jgi:hypothetical protein
MAPERVASIEADAAVFLASLDELSAEAQGRQQ